MSSVLQRIRQPEYTGANRCYPCTVVNAILAVVLAAGLALAVDAVAPATTALAVGAVSLAIAAAAIYVRGYLVPGTPTLTKRYMPDRVLRWFGKAPEGTVNHGASEAGTVGDVDPERLLVEAGALEPCAEVDDLCLTDNFATQWHDAIRETREDGTDRDRLMTVLDAGDLDLSFEERGDAFWARADGRRIGTWESRAAFLADVAAAPLLADRLQQWETLSVRARGKLLNGLRLFLQRCPDCDATLAFETETVESCCSTHDVAAVSCESCGARLFESDPL